MKKINGTAYGIAKNKLDDVCREIVKNYLGEEHDSSVRIGHCWNNGKEELGVNWSTWGTNCVEVAENFARAIEDVSFEVSAFNREFSNYEIEYDEEISAQIIAALSPYFDDGWVVDYADGIACEITKCDETKVFYYSALDFVEDDD